jgi:S1-C subfamily serine protease
MYSGGSGSVLLNTDMELVGINYATGTNKNGSFLYGFAVSVTHVRSYLETNNLMMQR